MKVLVLSDSHRDYFSLREAIRTNSDAKAIVFLGDGTSEWSDISSSLTDKQLIAVNGNCDMSLSAYPFLAIEKLGEHLAYCTHGHREFVKYGLETLIERAREEKADIVLYGHTHEPFTSYSDGLYIMNPGSVRQNSCGIIDITPKGILCYTKKIISEY